MKKPILLFHGKEDLVISYKQTLKITEELLKNNNHSEEEKGIVKDWLKNVMNDDNYDISSDDIIILNECLAKMKSAI